MAHAGDRKPPMDGAASGGEVERVGLVPPRTAPVVLVPVSGRVHVVTAADHHAVDDVEKLIEFVTAANEEMSRSIAELVRVARDAHTSGEDASEELRASTGMSLARLIDVEQRMAALRKGLWANGQAAAPEAAAG